MEYYTQNVKWWDIEDEQICKSILVDNKNLDILKRNMGNEYITKTIEYYNKLGLSLNDIFKSYERMPDLHIIQICLIVKHW